MYAIVVRAGSDIIFTCVELAAMYFIAFKRICAPSQLIIMSVLC